MKFNFTFLFTILLSAFCLAQTPQEAVTYLEAVGNQFQEISQKRMSYTSAASHGKSARKVDKKRQEAISAIRIAESTVRKMKPFYGDVSYRDSVVAYLVLNRLVLTEDYGKILNMEEIAEQSYDAMEAYLLAKEKAGEKLDLAYDRVKEQQNYFATKYKVKLVESNSRLGQKIETASKVFEYYNKVYLIFFKSYKNEAYLMDAINRNDINAIEQTKNALLLSATEGLEKIGPLSAFKGDASLKTACQQILNFYKMEAGEKVPEIISFYLKKENFEKMKAALDAKRPADRTQTDIDNVNKAGNDYNKAIEKVNLIFNELQKKGGATLNNWNNTSEKFLHTHVPKYNG